MQFDRTYFDGQYVDYYRQNPPRKLDFYRHLADRAAGAAQSPRILDFGCAFGLFLSHLGSRWERHGVDASEYAIQRARNMFPAIQFAVTQSGPIPFDGPFDVITAFDVLEHVEDVDPLLSFISRKLKRGGGFVFVVPVYDGPAGPFIRALDKDPTHVHKKSRRFWLDLAAGSFQIVEWWGVFRYLVTRNLYCHWVTRRFRHYAPAVACLARPLTAGDV